MEYGDIVTSRPLSPEHDFIRKMEATASDELLLVLDSDFLTFNMYNLKKQERYRTWEYKNEQRSLR